MATVTAADPGPWQLDIADRQQKLAATLRNLVAHASFAPDSPRAAELEAAATRLESADQSIEGLASLVTDIDASRVLVSQKLLPQGLLATRRVNTALERMQSASTLADVQRTAPAELCWAGDFDRVLFSRIEGSQWLPATWHVTNDPQQPANKAFGEFAHDARIPLTNGMIEAEIVRRRVTALVSDAQAEARTFRPLLDIAATTAYVVAPVVSGGSVVGLLHADAAVTGRALTESDRLTIRAFADGVGLLLERLALMERLQLQRARIAEALAAADQVVGDLCVAPVLMGDAAGLDEQLKAVPVESSLQDGLTSRERDVFGLLVGGATNAEIADRLTVSETTVKSHVKHILRKLRASNRAEAIAKYLSASNGRGVSS